LAACAVAVPAFAGAGGLGFTALPPLERPVGSEAGLQSVALADVDGDDRVDLVNIDNDDETVSIALGNGDGTFGVPVVLDAGDFPNAVAVADLTSPFDAATEGDIDGIPDVIVVDDIGAVQIFLGRGDGTFDPPDQSFDDLDSIELVALAVADFDGNDRLDLALLDAFDGVYFLCNFAGTLESCPTPVVLLDAFFFNPVDIVAGNFDGGGLDVAVVDSDTGELYLVSGGGDGSFNEEVTPIAVAGAAEARALRAGRIDGDAIDDLVVLTFDTLLEESGVTVFYGNDDPGELRSAAFAGPAAASAFALADFDADGALDALTVNALDDGLGGLSAILLGDGGGGFAAPSVPAGLEQIAGGSAVQSADLNGDDRPDIVAVIDGGERLRVALNGASPGCAGDCDGNRSVAVNELIRGVNIALELQILDVCSSFDVNGNGLVGVNELIIAVNNALNGCG